MRSRLRPFYWGLFFRVMEAPDSPPASEQSTEEGSPRARVQEAIDRFVTLWGEMASTWGINRTMAQIHALLYCVEQPLNTDQIMERLGVSRGNANMNLRSLVDWNLVAKTRRSGSRKDFYVAEKDVWQITARIVEERQRREIQPVQEQLRDCADLLVAEEERLDDLPDDEQVLHRRFVNLIELMEVFEGLSKALLPLVQNREDELIERLMRFAQLLDERRKESSD